MITVEYNGRFANNVIQYCIGRIIAETLGYELRTININRDLAKVYKLSIGYGEERFPFQEYFPNAKSRIPGKAVTGGPIVIGENDYLSINDITAEIVSADRPAIIRGFFQRSKYLLPYRDRIREWCAIKPIEEYQTVAHFRRGDYLNNAQDLPDSYYKAFCIDDFTIPAFGEFQERPVDGYRYVGSNDAVKDFRTIMGARSIICSNSSFAWLAAFLSTKAESVFIPRPQDGKYWSAISNQQLMCDLPGWELVRCLDRKLVSCLV